MAGTHRNVVVTMQDQVYRIVKEEICSGYYAPGQWLQEKELAEHLQVSRSPVREALRKLSNDGLVKTLPNKGTFVRVFTAKDIEEMYEFRVMMESNAIRKSARHLTPEMEKAMKDCLEHLTRAHQSGDRKDYIEYDTRLHTLMIRLGGNSLMEATYEKIHSIIQPFRIYSLLSRKRFDDSIAEHEGIILSILSGDAKKAEEINCKHLTLAKNKVVEYVTSKEYLSKCELSRRSEE